MLGWFLFLSGMFGVLNMLFAYISYVYLDISFAEKFDNLTPNFKFTHEFSEKSISFLDLIITVSEQKLKTILHIKSTDRSVVFS